MCEDVFHVCIMRMSGGDHLLRLEQFSHPNAMGHTILTQATLHEMFVEMVGRVNERFTLDAVTLAADSKSDGIFELCTVRYNI